MSRFHTPLRLCFSYRLFLALLLWGPAVLVAQPEADEDLPELAPFPVHGRSASTADQTVTIGVNSVNPSETLRETASSLGEMLSWEKGVSSSFYGGAASRPVIRGLEGYRVGIYEGGLATGDLSATSPDHAVAIEPLFIEEVTIFRGPAALFHGGSAIGGAIDALPDYLPRADQPEGWEQLAGVHYQTVDDGRTGLLKSRYRQGDWAVGLNLLARKTDDYRIPGYARTPDYDTHNRLRLPSEVRGQVASNSDGRVLNTHSSARVAALGSGWFPGNRTFIGGFQHYALDYGVPLDGHTHGNPYGTPGIDGPSVNDPILIELRQNRLFGEADLPLSGHRLEHANVKFALSDFRQKEREGHFLSNDFSQRTASFRGDLRHGARNWTSFTGASIALHDYRNRNVSYSAGRADEDVLETSSEQLALFSLQELRLGDTTLRAGVRGEQQTARRDDRNDLRRIGRTGSASFEINQRLNNRWSLSLGINLANRIPDPEELFIEAPHGATGAFLVPNPDLDVERSRGVELRIIRSTERLTFELTGFHRRFDSFIFLENRGFEVGGLTAYSHVQREARFTGGEAQLSWRIHAGHGSSLDLEVFVDHIRGEDLERAEPLPRMPPTRVGTTLKGRWGDWTASIQALHAFRQTRVPEEVFGTLSYQSPTDSHTLVSLGLERSWETGGGRVSATARISNLFDQEARQHTSFLKDIAPLPGRSLQLGLTLTY